MQGTRIAADEELAPLDERPQLGQIELSHVHDPLSRWSECLPGRSGDASGRFTIGWPGTEHDPPVSGTGRKIGDEFCKRRFGPAPKRIPGADVNDHQFVRSFDAAGSETTVHLSLGPHIGRHFYGIPCRVRPAGGPPVNRLE